jgi:hypothetical protein
MNENPPELLRTKWFNSGKGIVGIAAVRTDPFTVKFYISPVDGFNDAIDTNLVVSHGAPFPEDAGYALFGISLFIRESE